jgi:hypothetical protein
MARKIGVMVGREWSFPPAFIERVNARPGLVAEYVKLATPAATDPTRYDIILDRISHEVPFYRTYLRHAARKGVRVINDPFVRDAEDCFLGASLAHELGIATPTTVLLPHREYGPEIVHEESLRNLDYPLDWQAVLDRVGIPCVLRDAHSHAEGEFWLCHTVDELLQHYNRSGRNLMVVQQRIPWDHYVRCFVFGQTEALPLKYDPRERRYHVHHEHLSSDLGERLVSQSLALTRSLGYEINAVDWGIRNGEPWAADIVNPVPDFDIYALTPHYFERVVEMVVEMVARMADEPVRPKREAGRSASETDAAPTEGLPASAPASGVSDLAEELPSLARDLPRL